MVILKETSDVVLKIFGCFFIVIFLLVASYSLWELYMQKPVPFSAWDGGVCGVMFALGLACFMLRSLIGYKEDEDDSC